MTYTHKDKTYQDIFSLAKDLYLDSDFYAKELRDGEVLDFIKEQDEAKYERLQMLSLLSLSDDVFVFKAGEVLNPFMSFRLKGMCFETYQEIGEKMLLTSPNVDSVLVQIIRYDLLSDHMKTTFFSSSHKEMFETVSSIEKEGGEDIPYAYFHMAYYLSKKKSIYFRGKEYPDLYNLTYFLCKKEKDLIALGSYLSHSPLLKAYSLYSKEKEGIIRYLHLCEEVEKAKNNLDEFLEKRRENSEKISEDI